MTRTRRAPRSTSTACSRSASATRSRRLPDAAKATAVLAAAGSGTRLGAGGPKALVGLAGRPLLSWSLGALGEARSIASIIIAAPPGHEGEITELAGPSARVVSGGASRSRSVANALALAEGELVVVHDAARPLTPASVFDEVVAALAADPATQAMIAAAPLADTVKRAAGDRLEVSGTIDRSDLWAVQTPQAFRAQALRDALDAAGDELDGATDDAQLLEARGASVRLHPVAVPNLKVTTRADLELAEALLARGG